MFFLDLIYFQEPVIYVAGRPHVLRLVDRPLENVEYVGSLPLAARS